MAINIYQILSISIKWSWFGHDLDDLGYRYFHIFADSMASKSCAFQGSSSLGRSGGETRQNGSPTKSTYGAPWIPSIYPSHVSINIPAPWVLWVWVYNVYNLCIYIYYDICTYMLLVGSLFAGNKPVQNQWEVIISFLCERGLIFKSKSNKRPEGIDSHSMQDVKELRRCIQSRNWRFNTFQNIFWPQCHSDIDAYWRYIEPPRWRPRGMLFSCSPKPEDIWGGCRWFKWRWDLLVHLVPSALPIRGDGTSPDWQSGWVWLSRASVDVADCSTLWGGSALMIQVVNPMP